MSRLSFPRGSALSVALAAILLLGGCAAAPHAGLSAVTSAEWLALTAAELPGSGSLEHGASPAARPSADDDEDDDGGHGFVHGVLLYLPNRIFDVLDIVRLRVRVGPGFAAGVRATELADALAGLYTSVFIGIPGPRCAPFANWPVGFENLAGAELSVLDASSGGRTGPHYGHVEFGAGVHVALIGLDLGVDPWEAVDFVTGLLTIDLVGDDL